MTTGPSVNETSKRVDVLGLTGCKSLRYHDKGRGQPSEQGCRSEPASAVAERSVPVLHDAHSPQMACERMPLTVGARVLAHIGSDHPDCVVSATDLVSRLGRPSCPEACVQPRCGAVDDVHAEDPRGRTDRELTPARVEGGKRPTAATLLERRKEASYELASPRGRSAQLTAAATIRGTPALPGVADAPCCVG